MLQGIFPKSERLREIVGSHGWDLYDVTESPGGRDYMSWDEISRNGPAKQFEIGHNYLFAQRPAEGQTLRDARILTKGLGPALLVENPNDSDRWAGLYAVTNRYYDGKPVLFTRLEFTPKFLVAFTPPTEAMPDSDAVGIWYPKVIDTFELYFRIVTPEEEGLPTPVPMIRVPDRVEDN